MIASLGVFSYLGPSVFAVGVGVCERPLRVLVPEYLLMFVDPSVCVSMYFWLLCISLCVLVHISVSMCVRCFVCASVF